MQISYNIFLTVHIPSYLCITGKDTDRSSKVFQYVGGGQKMLENVYIETVGITQGEV